MSKRASTNPSAEEIAAFLKVFDRLSAYETVMRASRGWGAFKEEELYPDAQVIKVLQWLESKAVGAIGTDLKINDALERAREP